MLLTFIWGIAKVPIERGWRNSVPFFGLFLVVAMMSIAVSDMIGRQ